MSQFCMLCIQGDTFIAKTCPNNNCKNNKGYRNKKYRDGGKKMNKPNIVFDFDGVIHSYKSGWKGVDVIPDPPVEGVADVMQKLLDNGYGIMILSSRCEIKEGRLAMEKWLKQHNIPYTQIVAHKVPALVYVDDRGLKFDGNNVDTLFDDIVNFKTWMEV